MKKKITNIPRIRFKGFEGEWEEKHLSDIATMHARIGWQNLRKSEFLDEGDYYLITGTDFIDGEIDLKNCHFVTKDRYDQDPRIQLSKGSILITKDGTLGKVAYIRDLDKPATLNAGVFNVKVSSDDIDERYLFQYLKAPFLMNYATEHATGGTIKHLNQNILVNFPVWISEITEQEKIAELLDSLDKQISLYTQKCKLLKTQKQTFLQLLFPKPGSHVPEVRFEGFSGRWDRLKLGKLGSVEMCRRIYKDQTAIEGEIPFYKIGTFGGKADAFISRELFNEYKEKYPYPEKGAILISASGSIGRLVEFTGEEEYFQDSNIVWLKHDARVMNAFLKCAYEKIQWYGIEGTTIKRLYNKSILNTEINLPCIEEQTQIGAFFSSLDTNITLHEEKLTQLASLKQTLLKYMFV